MLKFSTFKKLTLRHFGGGFKVPEYPAPIEYVPKRIVC